MFTLSIPIANSPARRATFECEAENFHFSFGSSAHVRMPTENKRRKKMRDIADAIWAQNKSYHNNHISMVEPLYSLASLHTSEGCKYEQV